MPISAPTLEKLMAAGLGGTALIEVVASIDADMATMQPKRSTNAERQARYRKRHSVTSNVTDVTQQSNASAELADETPMSPLHPPKDITTTSSLRSEGAASAPDSRTLLFNQGLNDLAALSGKPTTKLRPLLGRWLKLVDDDALRILTLISKAKEARPAEPIAWIEKHFRPNGTGPPRNGSPSFHDIARNGLSRDEPDDHPPGKTIDLLAAAR